METPVSDRLRIAALVSSRRRQPHTGCARGGQQVGIYGGGADRGAAPAHGFANRIVEGVAGVLHEMPTVSDLGGVRQRLGRRKGVTAVIRNLQAD